MPTRREVLANTAKTAIATALEPLSAGVSTAADVCNDFTSDELKLVVKDFIDEPRCVFHCGIGRLLRQVSGLDDNLTKAKDASNKYGMITKAKGELQRNVNYLGHYLNQFEIKAKILRDAAKRGKRSDVLSYIAEVFSKPENLKTPDYGITFKGDEEKYFVSDLERKYLELFKSGKNPFNQRTLIRLLDLDDAQFEAYMKQFSSFKTSTQKLVGVFDVQAFEAQSNINFKEKDFTDFLDRQEIEVNSIPNRCGYYQIVIHAPYSSKKNADLVVKISNVVKKGLVDNGVRVLSEQKSITTASETVVAAGIMSKNPSWKKVQIKVPVIIINVEVNLHSEQMALMENMRQNYLDKMLQRNDYYINSKPNNLFQFIEGIDETEKGMKWAKSVLEAREVVKSRQAVLTIS